MIFQWLLDEEMRPQDQLLLSLYDHGAFSPRQFCLLADWPLGRLRSVIYRIRRGSSDKNEWIQTGTTQFQRDRSYYCLGIEGLRYCGRKVRERIHRRQVKDPTARNTHLLGLNEILVRLIGAGLDRERTIWLATRQAADYLYRMRRMQEPSIERRGLIQPDAFLRTDTHSYWIEYDAATEGVAAIEEKMERYHACLEPLQRRWVDDQGKWRRSLNKSPVIWVAKSGARRAYLQQIWEEWRMKQSGQQKGKIEMRFFAAGNETMALLPQQDGTDQPIDPKI